MFDRYGREGGGDHLQRTTAHSIHDMDLWQGKGWSLNSFGNCFRVLWFVGPAVMWRRKQLWRNMSLQLSFWCADIITATGNHSNYLTADICHDSTTLCYRWTPAAGHLGFVSNVVNLYTHQDTCSGFRHTVCILKSWWISADVQHILRGRGPRKT